MRRVWWLMPILYSLGSAALGQNLLTNGKFDTDLAGWEVANDGIHVLTVWQAADAAGQSDSGSAAIANLELFGEAPVVGLAQCVSVTAGLGYDVRASLRLPSGQAAFGQAEVRLFWYSSFGCSGFLQEDFALRQGSGGWAFREATFVAPEGARSVRVNLGVFKEDPKVELEAHVDDLFFGRQGTTDPPDPCESGATTLCLNQGRFEVETSWRRSNGATGQGQAVLLTADTGYFWFFDAANVEMVVKVLDACSAPTPRFWVFAGGLTNVEVEMRVTDTRRGGTKVYRNNLGTAFKPIQDTAAFATCP